MKQVDVSEAGLADLMAEAESGEDVVLTRQGHVVGRIVPLARQAGVPIPPDPEASLDALFKLRDQLAARGVRWTDDDLRMARNEGRD